MRWLLGRDPGDCAACGAELVRGAAWCGACGAAVEEPEPDTAGGVVEPEDHDTSSPVAPRRRRVVLASVALVAIGALVVAGLQRTPTGEPLLGTPAAASGMSATGPPPDGLRVAWRQPLVGDSMVGFSTGGLVEVAADQDRVAVDGRVVDRSTGRLVRLDPAFFRGGQFLEGDAVLRTDPLTGAQEQVATLPASDLGWFREVIGDVVVLNSDRGVVLRRADGTEIATVEGNLHGFHDRAEDDPALLPVREHEGGPDSRIRLVDPADGRVVRTLDVEGGTQVVDAIGPTVVRASTAAAVGGPGTGVEWDVEVLDPVTADVTAEGLVTSAQAPRLLGTTSDGGVVVGTRSGRTLTAWELRPGSLARPFVAASATVRGSDDPTVHSDGAITAQMALVGDLVVLVDGDLDSVRGVDTAGREVWRAPAAGAHRVGVGDGLVAVVPDDPTDDVERGTRVLQATDGSPVVVVPPGLAPHRPGRAPVVAYDGHVAIADMQGPFGGGLELRLAATRWFDQRDGSTTVTDEVLAPFLPEGAEVGLSWMLHGLTTTPDGAVEPVITRDLDSDTMQLLRPQEGFDAIDLEPLGRAGVVGYFAQVVGISPTHLLVLRQDFETGRDTTHIVDRATGGTRRLDDVVAVGMYGDVAIALADLSLSDEQAVAAVGLDVSDGSQRWRIEDARSILFGEHLVGDAEALVVVGRRGAALVDLDDGVTAWRYVAPEVLWSSTAVLGSRHLLLATTDGGVVALDRADGSEVWRHDVGTPITALTGAGDHVLVGTVDGLVIHLDGGGDEVQRLAVGANAVTSVAALGDTVVAVVGDGVVGLRTDGDGIVEQDQVDLP